MEKIDLNKKAHVWLEDAYKEQGVLISPDMAEILRHVVYSLPFFNDETTVRRLCKTAFCDFFDQNLRDVCVLLYLLGKYGLSIEMTDEKLAEYEGKSAPKVDSTGDIDWKQKHWELTKALFLQGHTYETSFTLATDFIEYYKKSLNTEE